MPHVLPPARKEREQNIYKTPGTNGISTSGYTSKNGTLPGYTNIVRNWNGSTEIEVVMNLNYPNAGSSWEWNATLYPKGGKPFTVIRNPTMINSTPPKVSTTGTIFQAKGGGRSTAGTPKGRPGGGGKVPPRRRGYVTRIVTPTTSSTGNTMVLTPRSATTKGSSKSGGSGKISKFFSRAKAVSQPTSVNCVPVVSAALPCEAADPTSVLFPRSKFSDLHTHAFLGIFIKRN